MGQVREVAFLFPGQGSQQPGMGLGVRGHPVGVPLLEVANESGIDLARLVETGTADELRPTQIAQPALYYTGVVLAAMAQAAGIDPGLGAGHSLGEYTALAAAGAIDHVDGMRLVLERGRLMARARQGTMAAVLGLEQDVLSELCEEASRSGEICVVANDNCPGQLVISGTVEGVEQVGARAKSAGAKKVVPLSVAGAFHSPLMKEAAREFGAALEQLEIRDPAYPVASGTTGQLMTTSAQVRESLSVQLESPVLWVGAVRALLRGGARRFLELGPGTTLAALVRRIEPGVEVGAAEPASWTGAEGSHPVSATSTG